MKKNYSKPTVMSSDKLEGVTPVAALEAAAALGKAIGLLAGFAFGRSVAKACRITSMVAQKGLYNKVIEYADI